MNDAPNGASATPCARKRGRPRIDDSESLAFMARFTTLLMSIGGVANDALAAREAVRRANILQPAAKRKMEARLLHKYRRQRERLLAAAQWPALQTASVSGSLDCHL